MRGAKGEGEGREDRFVAMVSAKAEVDLPLSSFHPRSQLRGPVELPMRARFEAIDYHNHLDAQDPREVLRIMDACGIELVVNITMQTGEQGLAQLRRFRDAAADRFATIGWMDWTGLERADFPEVAADRLERMHDAGACGIKLWKDLGLTLRDGSGALLRVDDERLDGMYAKAAELGMPVMFHTADPAAFFDPVDGENERYEELAAHPDWSFYGAQYSKRELLEQRNRVFARHPHTRFVGAHVGESPEDLAFVDAMLKAYPNVVLDISARVAELGRQPYRARELFLRWPERLVFGTDLIPDEEMYRLHFRFLETADEYFEYPSHASRQGRWNVYGLHLPDEVLRRVYRENARELLRRR